MPYSPGYSSWAKPKPKRPSIREGWRNFAGDQGNQAGLQALGSLMLQGVANDDPWGGILQGLAQFGQISKAERERLQAKRLEEEALKRSQQADDLRLEAERRRLAKMDSDELLAGKERARMESLRALAKAASALPAGSPEFDQMSREIVADDPVALINWSERRRTDKEEADWRRQQAEATTEDRRRDNARADAELQLRREEAARRSAPRIEFEGGYEIRIDENNEVISRTPLPDRPLSDVEKARMAMKMSLDGLLSFEEAKAKIEAQYPGAALAAGSQGAAPPSPNGAPVARISELEASQAIGRELAALQAADPEMALELRAEIDRQRALGIPASEIYRSVVAGKSHRE
jgi:hypothetical protein